MGVKELVENDKTLSFEDFKKQILDDYRLACISREMSIAGKKEVFSGKGKFGVFGDGKELAQLALSKVFKLGDFRAGYYRDQTLLLSLGMISVAQFFSQIYAHTSIEKEPCSGGRQMNAHFASRMLDNSGEFLQQTDRYNISADVSTTAGQIPRLVGLAQASKVYRNNPSMDKVKFFSDNGNEIAFGTIGDASTSQGLFWEGVNAAGVMQIPMIISVWDDGYGISVPSKYHHAKENIYECLLGFQKNNDHNGVEIMQVNGWDYPALVSTYMKAEKLSREKHVPVVVHVKELTQQLGHTTSGSHERYKGDERLEWEKEHDCLIKFEEWILNYNIENETGERYSLATPDELKSIQKEAKTYVSGERKKAWTDFNNQYLALRVNAMKELSKLAEVSKHKEIILKLVSELENSSKHYKNEVFKTLRRVIRIISNEKIKEKENFLQWYHKLKEEEQNKYSSHLYSESKHNYTHIKQVLPTYSDDFVDGRIVLRDNFEVLLHKYPNLIIFGEDVGYIGDVNQGLEGLQEKFGEERVFDTGIRESTIIGQGIGMAMRGLRPIAEIQYVDYVLFALETISDDLASLHYRTAGGQKAPLIIRTRGHRLEGIWHSGSPMAGLLNFMHGLLVLVPRNLTKAAGFYNALLKCDNPAIVIETLNGYRLKEEMPSNLGEFTTPIGEVEVTKEGSDITLVTYGSTWRIVDEAAKELKIMGIDAEIIDIQSLIPFDISHNIVKSIQKTNRLAVIDEDVPGGASAYILRNILEEQGGYKYLDSPPITITARSHRPPYSTDGDYFTKPSTDDIIEAVYQLMHEAKPTQYPSLF